LVEEVAVGLEPMKGDVFFALNFLAKKMAPDTVSLH
jgi:hypothetical protein